MNQYNRMLQEQLGITSVMEGYAVAYNSTEHENDSIAKLKE